MCQIKWWIWRMINVKYLGCSRSLGSSLHCNKGLKCPKILTSYRISAALRSVNQTQRSAHLSALEPSVNKSVFTHTHTVTASLRGPETWCCWPPVAWLDHWSAPAHSVAACQTPPHHPSLHSFLLLQSEFLQDLEMIQINSHHLPEAPSITFITQRQTSDETLVLTLR